MFASDPCIPNFTLHFWCLTTFLAFFRKDVFQVTTGNLGDLQKIQLRSDDTGDSPDWYIEKVNICTSLSDFQCHIFDSFSLHSL